MAFLDETGLAELWSLTKDCVNWYVWEKRKVATYNGFKTQTTQSAYSIFSNANNSKTYYYADSYSIDDSFSVSLVSPQSVVVTGSQAYEVSSFDVFKGKYLLANNSTYQNGTSVVFVPNNAVASVSGAGMSLDVTFSSVESYSDPGQITEEQSYGYVGSSDPNAYPINDGYTYVPMGQLGEKTRIATGSYTGTGTYGASNPNSLTFDFEPKLVMVYRHDCSPTNGFAAVFAYSCSRATSYPSSATKGELYVSWQSNAVSWYHTGSNGADYQLNATGEEYGRYYYVAIG